MCIIRGECPHLAPDPDHEAACRSFVERIRDRNGINLQRFDLGRWGRGAASTLNQSNRSGQHDRLSDATTEALAHEVWNEVSKCSCASFDAILFGLFRRIRNRHLPFMSFGRTQKFVNILCKYAYTYYWSGLDPAWSKAQSWVGDLSACFHIPVDGVVLHNLRVENRPWFKPLVTTPVTTQQGTKYARFWHGDNAVGWSELDRAYPYVAVQQYVIDNLNGALTPLHREMRDLWR